MDDDDLLPMHDDEPAGDFDVVLRGYDRRQVNDHLARFEAALGEAHDRQVEDAQRIAALERQVTEQHERLVDAERRPRMSTGAGGLPVVGQVNG